MVVALIAWVVLALAIAMQTYVGMPSSFTLLEHQSGILYRRGRPLRLVGAGRHRVWLGIEKILFIDARPVSVSFENRAVTLADGSTAVYGFSASVEVVDARKAIYCAGNYSEMPAFVLLCCARSVLNTQNGGEVIAKQSGIVEEIAARARPRLSDSGFRLLAFRMTQLGLASPTASNNDQESN